RSQVSGLRSQVSGLRSQVSGLRSQVSGLRSQVSDFRFQISDFPEWDEVLVFGFCEEGARGLVEVEREGLGWGEPEEFFGFFIEGDGGGGGASDVVEE
ncbi:MAG: hypothetical protein RLZZ245_3557, partial [Verrucomicrobiota bacterium]